MYILLLGCSKGVMMRGTNRARSRALFYIYVYESMSCVWQAVVLDIIGSTTKMASTEGPPASGPLDHSAGPRIDGF